MTYPAHWQGPWLALADKDFDKSSVALSALVTALDRLGSVAILYFVPRLNRVRTVLACMRLASVVRTGAECAARQVAGACLWWRFRPPVAQQAYAMTK